MSDINFREYRDGIRRIRDLTQQARQVAVQMVAEGLPAKNVRASLYKAIQSLDIAAMHVDDDLINQDQTERDLS